VIEPLRQDPVAVEHHQRYGNLLGLAVQGQIGADTGCRTVLAASFSYLEMHLGPTIRTINWALRANPELLISGRLRLTDLGCGGGTAAIAAWLVLGRLSPSSTLSYVGIDHNRHARDLARKLIGETGVAGSLAFPENAEAIVASTSEESPLLVVGSHVFNQDGVSAATLDAWASRLSHELGSRGLLLALEPPNHGTGWRLGHFLAALTARGVASEVVDVDTPRVRDCYRFRYLLPVPGSDWRTGRVRGVCRGAWSLRKEAN
jgi:hypothetical protein